MGRSRRDGPVRILLRQLTTPLIYVLLASAAAAWFLGKAIDAAVSLAVVVINALVGFVQEWQAGEAIEALSRMVPLKATVLREGEAAVLPAEDVVPGDLGSPSSRRACTGRPAAPRPGQPARRRGLAHGGVGSRRQARRAGAGGCICWRPAVDDL